jgi:NAD(P)-dependent dehydrogenase (short-subunit alcohol dehydrogenase family)
MNLNLKTPFFLTKALAAPLCAGASADKPAKVINVESGTPTRHREGGISSTPCSKSIIRKSGHRFSLATKATRLRGDHAQTKA